MSDFEITGADSFFALSKALKAAGRTGMRRELNAAMRRGGKPLLKVAKQAAADVFPKEGGMSQRESTIPFRAVTRTSPNVYGLFIQAAGRYVAAKTTNKSGSFRHPVYGGGADKAKTREDLAASRKTWRWVDQEIPGSQGWFDRAMTAAAPAVRPELEKAIQNVADEIVKGARA